MFFSSKASTDVRLLKHSDLEKIEKTFEEYRAKKLRES